MPSGRNGRRASQVSRVHSSAAQRPVYRHADLERVLNPSSIAIVGASSRPGSFGERLLGNLAAYCGRVHLVNAKYDSLGERPCFRSLAALPEVPDCVAVAVPREAAEAVVLEAAEVGAGGVILYASGYAETRRSDRLAEQERLAGIASSRGLRILGPNCLGIANYQSGARITFADYPAPRPMRTPAVGIASQSGALSQSLAQAIECGASVSHVFSAGNQVDVDVADLVAYLADDPNCHAIACAFEGLAQPQRLMEAAQIAWRANKPLLVNKIATGQMGAEAAVSHTGSLAGSNAAYRAAFERTGMVLVEDFEALLEAASFFSKAPPPKARGVAVLATSGGAAIMAADRAEAHGIPLPQPSEAARRVLEEHIPDFGSARNPCDVTAQVVNNPKSLWACGEALLGDESYGAIVMPQPVAFDFHIPRIGALSELSRRHGKITCNVLISGWLQGPGSLEAQIDPHVALFRTMERCFSTLEAWHWRAAKRSQGERVLTRVCETSAKVRAAALLDEARHSSLTEREAKAVLAAYGVPVVSEVLVSTAAEACDAAATLGFPVALKVESPDLPHKTEAGVIRLNLSSVEDVQVAFEAVMTNARRGPGTPRINGVLVQPMIPSGVEIMVGARVDPLFGSLIVVGFGGTLVELLKDTAVELAPVTHHEALSMLRRLKGAALLDGFRGAEPVDVGQLAEIICRLSELAADQTQRISELDVNPLICAGRRIIAVDALISRKQPD
jgi:acyl-CoA synthetase (NDP forming)